MKRSIVWFRNDLRLHDNEALCRALEENDEVIPVFCFDIRQFKKDRWGHYKTGPYRGRFLFQSVQQLKLEFQARGSDLIIMTGKTEDCLLSLTEKYSTKTIYASKAYTSEEIQQEESILAFAQLNLYHTATLVHPDDLPFYITYLPDVFTQFRKSVEKQVAIRKEFNTPNHINSPEIKPSSVPKQHFLIPSPVVTDSRAVLDFKGGSKAGESRVNHYIWKTKSISTYKKTRNGLLGADYSSKFSPWLSNGSLSAKQIYWEVKQFEKTEEKNQSTYWLVFELLWRDYFQFIAMKYGNRIFRKTGIKQKPAPSLTDKSSFGKWKAGETDDKFVNANMKELSLTGFMSNRGRQNVASYLVHDLNIDWRMGASWFESQLIDYDPCANYGNWLYISGVGNDPRPNRKFNTVSQALRYDSDGSYRKHWLVEV